MRDLALLNVTANRPTELATKAITSLCCCRGIQIQILISIQIQILFNVTVNPTELFTSRLTSSSLGDVAMALTIDQPYDTDPEWRTNPNVENQDIVRDKIVHNGHSAGQTACEAPEEGAAACQR